jgi:hypothetical protein
MGGRGIVAAPDHSSLPLPDYDHLSEAVPEHERHNRRHVAAHEHAAKVHDQAVKVHLDAAEFFDEHGMADKARQERALAEREAKAAEAERQEARELGNP